MTTVKLYRQDVFGGGVGDCFRACMATLIQLPPVILPNDHSPLWQNNWNHYLSQFGLALAYDRAKGPIWQMAPWIAAVPSLNLEGANHAIVMHNGGQVLHDPSRRQRYKAGQQLDSSIVIGGWHLVVASITKLSALDEYRNWLTPSDTQEAEA